MNKESLIQVKNLLISTLSNSDIDITDKTELMININNFLDEKKYEDNVKVLSKKIGE